MIWSVLVNRMESGRWYELSELYTLIEHHVELLPDDYDADAPRSVSPRWQRNVRNVLQRRKTAGDLDWNRPGRYRLT